MPPEKSSEQEKISPAAGDSAERAVESMHETNAGAAMRESGATRMDRQAIAFAIAVAGWLVPGLGHAILKMWARAATCFLTVGLLVALGTGMKGNIFTSGGSDAFDKLGYLADLGAGSFYFFARRMETSGADVSHATGDYGTRFLATAGILNLLAALHAFEAARGHKA